MNRKVIFIIIGAIAFALVVGLVWFWFFRGGAPAPATGGSFGTGADKAQTSTTGANNQNNIPSNVSGSGQGGNTSSQTISVSGGGSGPGPTIQPNPGVAVVPGVEWLGGSGGSGGGATTNFVPKTINQLNDGSVGGSPGIVGSFGSTDTGGNSGNGLGLAGLLGTGAGCALYASFQGLGEAKAGAEGAASAAGGFVLVYDWRAASKQSSNQFKDIGDCLARTIGKAVIQQMTNSIVNWINSGFNGKPSFVTNFDRFFTNVGDQAAGEFIRGTGLAFLCSPFKLQIRVAIAQSYARRNNAASCTLTGVIKNINGFMNGNFSQGGWGGLIQFTTVPTNNPYGAYAYAQVGLATAQQNAINNAKNNMTPTGFLNLQEAYDCQATAPQSGAVGSNNQTVINGGIVGQKFGSSCPSNCKCRVTTPGSIIEDSLKTTLQQPFLANQLAQSFDQIVSALLNQLVTKTLYSGLSSLSGTSGYAANYLTPEQQQAQAGAQTLLTDMQGRLQVAQQYGSVMQGSIQDIQNTQQQLQGLANCWTSKDKNSQASTTEMAIYSYNAIIDGYNGNITRANAAIAALQDFQTRIINIASAADVTTVRADYDRALASGALVAPADVTNAQQDRVTLQASLQTRNQTTATELDQCNASQ